MIVPKLITISGFTAKQPNLKPNQVLQFQFIIICLLFVIFRIMLSVYLCPKVITLKGYDCTTLKIANIYSFTTSNVRQPT